MESLEPEPGFYDKNGYGEYEKQFLHYATVSMLNISVCNNSVIWLQFKSRQFKFLKKLF